MKFYKYIAGCIPVLALSAIVLLNTGCQDEIPGVLYDSGDHIRFQSASSSLSEDPGEDLAIPLIFTKTSEVAATVTINVEETNYTLGSDYVFLQKDATGALQPILTTPFTVDFSGGEYMDSIFFRPFDDTEENTVDRTVLLTLSSAGVTVGFPGPDSNNSQHLITIADDDNCPQELDVEIFASATYTATDESGASFAGSFASGGTGVLIATNLGGVDDRFSGQGLDAPTAAVLTLTGGQTGTISLSGETGYVDSGTNEPLSWSGTGTYDMCTISMDITWNWVTPDGTVFNNSLVMGSCTYSG